MDQLTKTSLKEIDRWRADLAQNIAIRNKDLRPDDLETAVQRIILRLVFLRLAEERGMEPREQLLSISERGNVFKRFVDEPCRRAGRKYKAGLFHFEAEDGVSEAPDRVTPDLVVDDAVFKPILQSSESKAEQPFGAKRRPPAPQPAVFILRPCGDRRNSP